MSRQAIWTVAVVGLLALAFWTFVSVGPGHEARPTGAIDHVPDRTGHPGAVVNRRSEATPAVPLPPATDGSGTATLADAVAAGDVGRVRHLLEGGASPDASYADGNSVLGRAIDDQHGEITDLLLDAGARLDTRPGMEPLVCTALRTGDETLALDLLQRGAPATVTNGESPLVTAIVHGANEDVVAALLAAGAEVNVADGNGDTPLAVAIAAGDAELVDRLLNLGARVNVVGADGMTPLQLATDAGESGIVDLLQQAGATE